MSLLAAALLPVLLALGFWQLDRAAEKRAYVDAYLARQGELPAPPGAALEPFQRVRLDGRYEPGRVFLVDNQVNAGRVGYWVVSSFRADSGARWLVNRGWVAAPAAREEMPVLETPEGAVSLTAVVWPDTGLPPLLRRDDWGSGWPKRVQRLNVLRMAALLEGARPVQLRAEAGQPGVLIAAPVDVVMNPERHTGYAVQWFGLAVVLLLGYLAYGFRISETEG